MVLHLSHHKSYHVYNAENIARVRRDEENARKEATDLATLAKQRDSEARLDLLRKRAKGKRKNEGEDALERQLKSRSKNDTDDTPEQAETSRAVIVPPPEPEKVYETNGHVNFWPDLEKDSNDKLAQSRRGNPEHEAEKKKEQDKWDEMTTMYLGKPAKELKPWYSNADLISGEDRKRTEDQWQELKLKDDELKNMHDPLKVMNSFLKRRDEIQKNPNDVNTPRSEFSTPVPTLLRRKRRHMPADRNSSKDAKHNKSDDDDKRKEEAEVDLEDDYDKEKRKARKREKREDKKQRHEDKKKQKEEKEGEREEKMEKRKVDVAVARESSERERARALIEGRKKGKEKPDFDSTPLSTSIHGLREDRFNMRWSDDVYSRRRQR